MSTRPSYDAGHFHECTSVQLQGLLRDSRQHSARADFWAALDALQHHHLVIDLQAITDYGLAKVVPSLVCAAAVQVLWYA